MIEIYSKPQCPYCVKAKNLCEREGYEYTYKMLDEDLQNLNSGQMDSEEFRSFHLYLPPEEYQDVLSERYNHIFRSIDKTQNEVRIYVKGLDFWEHDYDLPFATLNGKKKSFENLWKEAIGEKKIEE